MFIGRTTIKSRESGEPYCTYRLVEAARTAKGVRQRTVLNLGRHFEVPRSQWGPLAQRIEALVQGQLDLIVEGLDPCWEAMAQQYAARIVSRRGQAVEEKEEAVAAGADYQRVDLATLEVIRPRSVGAEHVALAAAQQLGLEIKLAALGFNPHQLAAAMGLIVGRMVCPGSELATHQWLQQRSGLKGVAGLRLQHPGLEPPVSGERSAVGAPRGAGERALPAGAGPVRAGGDHHPV